MPDICTPANASDALLFMSRESGEALTNLKLQKLLYYSQAWYLTLHGEELFAENFQAWVHGPVLPSQYFRFSANRWRQIEEEVGMPALSDRVRDHFSEILQVFGSETAVALEQMTHEETPWIRARGDLPAHALCQTVIQKEWMTEYYRAL